MRRRWSDGGEPNRWEQSRCYNCGGRNHLSVNCPTKVSGVKCFGCDERGHVAAGCCKAWTKGTSAERTSCVISGGCDGKYYKTVCINNYKVLAMINTGSDMCLMRADCHDRLHAPLRKK